MTESKQKNCEYYICEGVEQIKVELCRIGRKLVLLDIGKKR